VTHVHHCYFCGWDRPATSATVFDPACERCGGTLRAVAVKDLDRVRTEEAETGFVAPSRHTDIGALFGILVMAPWVLPLVGVRLGDIVFAVPLIVLAFAAAHTLRTGLMRHSRRAAAAPWLGLAGAAATAAAASAVTLVCTVVSGDAGDAGFYLGASGSALLLVGAVAFARPLLAQAPIEALVDGALAGLMIVGATVAFVTLPALNGGDVALTAIVIVDLFALLTVSLCAIVVRDGRRVQARWLVGACAAAMAGDALVSLSAAGIIGATTSATAVLWAVAGFAIATASDLARAPETPSPPPEEPSGWHWGLRRLLVPLLVVLSFPAAGFTLQVTGHLHPWQRLYWGLLTIIALALAFGRQAYLLLERQRAVVRERALRHEATRRSEELEALTGLATTMTQTLEEAPIVEQALEVLQTAARATSTALHVPTADGRMTLHATTGQWQAEHAWAGAPPADGDDVGAFERGGRAILRLTLAARGTTIGVVTLVRPSTAPFDTRGVELLALLVDQMGVAVQNARDYRARLEEAIRDPLTGAYNRRFMLEALEKEVQRSERYGSEASLVIFDVDDFKQINDSLGHAAGDEVLRRLTQVADGIIRPSDSFARIGGEEFALLLPETSQLEGLLVAERLRTAISRQQILPGRRVTVSGGVASCPQDAIGSEELQQRADAALYWAKRNGKDMSAVASEVTDDGTGGGSDGVLAHLYALVTMIDAQHLHTRDHSENVASYAVALGQELGLDRERIVRLRRAAMLHDVGKVAVDGAILDKPDRLTAEEYEAVQAHSAVGGQMLAHAGLHLESAWIRHHHERLDGGGYPAALAGDEIPFEARIIFVADSFEAMTSDRPYRAGMPIADALAELRRCAGTQFDPQVVAALAGLVESGRLAVLALRDSEIPRPA
jgi:diguanylate cyclase (GGDEF)-like protein